MSQLSPYRIRRSHPGDVSRLIEIWRGSVEATHHFLALDDRAEIDQSACAYLAQSEFWVLVGVNDWPLAFSATTGSNLDALFVAADARGRGLGKKLVQHALSLSSSLTTQVNEQNADAVGFYSHLGFTFVRRDERDQSGRPYPILQLRYGGGVPSLFSDMPIQE